MFIYIGSTELLYWIDNKYYNESMLPDLAFDQCNNKCLLPTSCNNFPHRMRNINLTDHPREK